MPEPKNKMAFLLDWLVTLKCNYDCTYCGPGINGDLPGHDNSKAQPKTEDCLRMLEQGLRYVDTYMDIKRPNMRSVNLNIYGGEALYMKDILYILEQSSSVYSQYKDKWSLNRMLTTNASCSLDKWKNIIQHIENVTLSFHSQGPAKLQDNFLRNIEYIHNADRQYDSIVLMYPGEWKRCTYILEYLTGKGYNVRPKILDGPEGIYTKEQLQYIFDVMKEKDYSLLDKIEGKPVLKQFRGCCGGRTLCTNRDFRNPTKVVARETWKGWKCSANQFFLMMNTDDKKFYTNKDCHVRHDGTRGPIADIHTMDDYISDLKNTLGDNRNHFLTCVQQTCVCGTCAPKSITQSGLEKVMANYNLTT